MTNLVERLLHRIRSESHGSRRIVVIGDVMVDRWVHGHLERCQDDCLKFVQNKVVEVPGGAANAERSLSDWGVNTSLYGYAQNDCPTKTRYVVNNRIIFRSDDDGLKSRSSDYEWARKLGSEMVNYAGAVLISDYDKGFLTPEFISQIVGVCKDKGIPCVADPKREPDTYKGAIVKCNYQYSLNHAHLAEVITDGVHSPFVYGDREPNSLPTIECLNHVGAGDCFAAHLTLALAYDFTLREAATLAHSAGRVYVQYKHNRPPHPNEIAADLAHLDVTSTST